MFAEKYLPVRIRIIDKTCAFEVGSDYVSVDFSHTLLIVSWQFSILALVFEGGFQSLYQWISQETWRIENSLLGI